MKKILLSSVMALSVLTLQAQKKAQVMATKVEGIQTLSTANKGTATTSGGLFPKSFDSCELFLAYKSDNSGYVSGNNGYGDKEKTMTYKLSNFGVGIPATVDTVKAIFKSKIGNGAGQVRAKVYAKTSVGLGALLGTSNPVSVASIDTAGANLKFTNFIFTTPVTIPDEFVVSIDFNSLYATSDSLGLVMTVLNNDGCSFVDSAQAGEIWDDDTYTLVSAPNSWATKFDMAIFPFITATLSVRELTAQQMNFKAFPQPAADVLHIHFTGQEKGAATIRLIDVTGRVVMTQSQNVTKGGAHQLNFNTSSLPAGIYVAQLNHAGTTASIKVMIH